MPERQPSIDDALRTYDSSTYSEYFAAAERERSQILAQFPITAWSQMPLERYAIGQSDEEDTFCRWLEFQSPHLGSIRGGSARKLIIYKHRDAPGWYFPREYRDEREAWERLRTAFVRAFALAEANDWAAIDDIPDLQRGPAVRLKTLYIYFPQQLLPIASQTHLRHFLRLLKRPEADNQQLDVIRLNRALLDAVRNLPGISNWTTNEMMRFLYHVADPRDQKRIVKISPGDGGKYWNDCLQGGYICVGWDEVGDLREFESKELFRSRFEKEFGKFYNDHQSTISKKANEAWTMAELEPGDVIVANQGTSHIFGVGEVIEPGYKWRPERSDYKHTVSVRWDQSYETDIPPQKRWGVVTVDKVPANLYEKILAQKGGGGASVALPPPPPDPIFATLAAALERRGQAILYGPPGTGKTYTADRFSLWWLPTENGGAPAGLAFTNPEQVASIRESLTTARTARRVWWMVASAKEWHWDQLLKDGTVDFREGRLRKNYGVVKEGDLVVGYQSAPEKKLVALARVKMATHTVGGENKITLESVSHIKNGPTYDDLISDPHLNNTEPMRFRNQGTLFALTSVEAEYLLSLLAERDADLQQHLDGDSTIGTLTRVTFHPSYSYEDFIEGFRPIETSDGTLSLRLEDGIFKRVCEAARAQPDKKFLLLIDEINRANLAKVFGEIITLIEKDKRGVDVTLPQSKASFCVPDNLFILGTMNTADRSIRLLDAALRRRFAFVELMPDLTLLRGAKIRSLPLDDFLQALNQQVVRKFGREKQVGHSFLLDGDQPVSDAAEFARCFRQEILPLLQEYCYEDYGSLADIIGEAFVDRDGRCFKDEILDDDEALLTALEERFAPSARSED
jgi:5-methylcytosine-specific restriction protein B